MKKMAIICLLLSFCICFEACELAASEPHILKLNTTEKVAEVFYANEEYFNAAVETILTYHEKEPKLFITPIEEAWDSDVYVGKEINGLYIESRSMLTDSDYQILSDAFAPLMERCPFSGVDMHASWVQFTLEGPKYGLAAELYYFLDADFAAEYTAQSGYLMITPHWYATIWSD